MNRRQFIRAGAVGLAGLPVLQAGAWPLPVSGAVDRVKLGGSGLKVSRIAMGTGTRGFNKESNQTRLGREAFVRLAHQAYERGIRFYDMADGYGSMPFVGEAIRTLPREKIVLLTKMWTYEEGSERIEDVAETIDRFRRETGSDYLDVLLMHCLSKGDWDKTRTRYMDGFLKAKQARIVKAVGVSCHHIDALRTAASHPWVDVIMARINPFGTLMDGSPEEVKEILATAKRNGKGVIGMKIFGEGKHVAEEERERSIRFALREGNIHCMTLGLESVAQMEDAIERVRRNVR
jgi:predicted aldo/keto reductase-like oxidoreductase